VRITYIGHATLLIELDGLRILTDPLLRDRLGPLRRHGPSPDATMLRGLDAVLVSHAHPDHFDRPSLRLLADSDRFVVPMGLGPRIRRLAPASEIIELHASAATDLGDVRLTAIRARHWRWPAAPRVRTLGYLLEGSIGVYFAGDTGAFPEMEHLRGRVDVALLPIGRWGPHPGPNRLEPASAARVAHLVGARIAIPVHWGTFYPFGFERLWPRPLREPPGRFVAAAAREAPNVDIRVLQPGDSTMVGIDKRTQSRDSNPND
jgi:L-ascorbate metabolism protein UlaG (beta-lactamase superfamily)